MRLKPILIGIVVSLVVGQVIRRRYGILEALKAGKAWMLRQTEDPFNGLWDDDIDPDALQRMAEKLGIHLSRLGSEFFARDEPG